MDGEDGQDVEPTTGGDDQDIIQETVAGHGDLGRDDAVLLPHWP